MGKMTAIANRLLGAVGLERRSSYASGSWDQLFPGSNGVSPRAAENLSTVLACTSAISSALAYIPALVYRRNADGNRIEALDHPLTQLFRAGVSDNMTWPEFIEHWVASTLLQGNGLAEIVTDSGGAIASLAFHPWANVSVQRLSSGRLAYDISDPQHSGRTRRLLQGEVLHLRDRTDDGLIGRSRLSRASETVKGIAAANDFSRMFLENGLQPSAVLTTPQVLNAERMSELRRSLDTRYQGTSNAGKLMLLHGGMEFKALQMSPEDSELLETRKFGVEEICRMYQVPPPLVQDYSHNTFTNSETAGRWFAQFTLAPWARKIEAIFAQTVFPAGSGLELEMDLSGFLRGDPKARWDSHKIAIDTGVLDPDEVRQIEGWNPRGAANA